MSSSAATDLRNAMQGRVVTVGDEDYFRVRRIWNNAVGHAPALFALCETVADVQAAVRTARAQDLPLSVRGGGHDWAGRALSHGGLVIDLSRMRQVEVDAGDRVATVAGGALGADVSAAATPHGLAAITGNVGAVGQAGFLLAGGYGPLTTRFGMAVDSLLGAEVVLADGRRVWADGSHERDLFWALRGGGGNFGVVTSMRIRLHPVDRILAGLILFPWSASASVLRAHAEIMSSAPAELSMLIGLVNGTDGEPMLFLGPIWTGSLERGAAFVSRLESLGTPISSDIGPMRFTDLLALYDRFMMTGDCYALETLWLADLTPEIVSAVVAAGAARTSPRSILACHHFHGPGTEIAPDATAFAMRRPHFMFEIVAAWDQDAEGDVHRGWTRDLSTALAPHALPGGYANFLAPDAAHDRIAAAYGCNAGRLAALKRSFDPDNVFSSAIPLPM